jgi:hypothetical protein
MIEPLFELILNIPEDSRVPLEIERKKEFVCVTFNQRSITFTDYSLVQCEYAHNKSFRLFGESIAGLSDFCLFKVMNSPLVYSLMIMNRVHQSHKDSLFSDDIHFLIKTKSVVLECIASGYNYE